MKTRILFTLFTVIPLSILQNIANSNEEKLKIYTLKSQRNSFGEPVFYFGGHVSDINLKEDYFLYWSIHGNCLISCAKAAITSATMDVILHQ